MAKHQVRQQRIATESVDVVLHTAHGDFKVADLSGNGIAIVWPGSPEHPDTLEGQVTADGMDLGRARLKKARSDLASDGSTIIGFSIAEIGSIDVDKLLSIAKVKSALAAADVEAEAAFRLPRTYRQAVFELCNWLVIVGDRFTADLGPDIPQDVILHEIRLVSATHGLKVQRAIKSEASSLPNTLSDIGHDFLQTSVDRSLSKFLEPAKTSAAAVWASWARETFANNTNP